MPPRLAPVQAVVIAVRDEPEVNEAAESRRRDVASSAGVRVEVDRGRGSFGRRVTDWEIKGVPLRVRGRPSRPERRTGHPRAARQRGEGAARACDTVAANALALLGEIQVDMFNGAKASFERTPPTT